jgi:para-aminobenzoate synthetase/4-amino-4-deoxychorismate lyase
MGEPGVFETIRCVGGVLQQWEAHLTRLEGACAWLGVPLPPEIRGIEVSGDAKVNIDVWPSRWALRTAPLPAPFVPVQLDVAGRLPGPAHIKHTARGDWEPRGVEVAFVEGGAWTETSRANLFFVRRGALWTHPLDGRVLPGVTRQRVLSFAREMGLAVVEAPVSVGAAEEVFTTSALRLLAPVTRLGDAVYAGWGPVSRLLSARLTTCSAPSA